MRCAYFIAAGLLLCQTALAKEYGEPIYYVSFSKPGANYATFMSERNACLESTSNKVREHYVDRNDGRYFGVNLTYHIAPLIDCMTAHGYVRDAAGHHAIGYQIDKHGNMWGVPMDEWH